MTKDRYKELMDSEAILLTDEEIDQGWHFCADWDGLLIGPEMEEQKTCTCLLSDAQESA